MNSLPSIVSVYTGNGKGKTTAALGLLVRACGAGWRVGLVRLLKDESSSEMAILAKLNRLKVLTASPELTGFCSDLPIAEQQTVMQQARAALTEAARWIEIHDIDLLVVDEVIVAIDLGLVDEEQVLRLFSLARQQGVDLVVTGRNASAELQQAADLVTEMREVKHPFQEGFPARRGFEF